MTDPTKVKPKDAKEPFDRKDSEDHFEKTGQSTDEIFGTTLDVGKEERQ